MEQTTETITPAVSNESWPDERRISPLSAVFERRELIRSLILRDIHSRYKQSLLGIAWALLQPLAMMLVFTVVFAGIAQVKTSVPYPIFSYTGLLLWSFFAQGLSAGTECLVANYNLITKVYFPREVLPVAAVLGKTVDLLLGFCLLAPLLLVYSIKLTPLILLVIPIVIVQLCFMTGLSLMLSAANLFYRDVKHVVPLMLTVWMYLTPVVYPLDKVPAKYMTLYMLNPMSAIVESYRRVVLFGRPPLWGDLALATGVSMVMLVMGYLIFKAVEPKFAEMI